MSATIYSVVDRHKALDDATTIRMALWANGYKVLPARQKQVLMKGWPQIEATPELIESWRSSMDWRTTAIKIEGSMVAIDIDVNDAEMIGILLDELYATIPQLAEGAPVRHGSGHKLMVLCRCSDDNIGIFRSKRMLDEAGTQHHVEIFGGATTRYFTVYGPHTEGAMTADGVEVKIAYAWEDGPSPIDTRPEDLPAVTREDLIRFYLRASVLMAEHGWAPAPMTHQGEMKESRVADIEAGAEFDLLKGVTVAFEDLGAHIGDRCSASFLGDPSFRNRSRCMIGLDPDSGAPRVFDFEDYCWHMAAGSDVRPVKAKKDEKQKASALMLGDLLGRHMEPSKVSFASPASKAVEVDNIDGRDLTEWPFVDWLMARYAYLPHGASNERVIDVVNGRAYALDAFHGMWVAKTWDEDTGETFASGPREGEAKVVKVVPTKTWFHDADRITLDGFRFSPSRTATTRLIEDGGTWLNLYTGPGTIAVTPHPDAYAWWEDFLEHLIPDPDELSWFMNWLSYKYQNPAARGQAVIFVSPTGDAGRGVLFRIIGAVFENHVSKPAASDLTGSSGQAVFNGWVENCVLAMVDELMADGANIYDKRKAYEALKDNVDPLPKSISVNEKGRAKRSAVSHVSLMSATNHTNALPLDASDRRFTVLSNGDRLTARRDLLARYDAMQDANGVLLPGFVAAIRTWLDAEAADRHAFMTPLLTDAKSEMISGNAGKIDDVLEKVLGSFEAAGRMAVYINEVIARVEQEVKARGYSSGLEMVVAPEVTEKLRKGCYGWEYPRKSVRVSDDKNVAPTRTVVMREPCFSEASVAERVFSLGTKHE